MHHPSCTDRVANACIQLLNVHGLVGASGVVLAAESFAKMGLYVGVDNEAVPVDILLCLGIIDKSDRLRGCEQ